LHPHDNRYKILSKSIALAIFMIKIEIF